MKRLDQSVHYSWGVEGGAGERPPPLAPCGEHERANPERQAAQENESGG